MLPTLVVPESPGDNGYCATGIPWHSAVMASIAAAPIAILLCSERLRRFYFVMKGRPEQSGLHKVGFLRLPWSRCCL